MSSIDTEKQKNQEFAEKHGINESEMERIYQEIFEGMPEDMDENKKIIRSLRKTRGSLRRLVQSGQRMDGFIIMRFPDQEYNLYAWNQVDRYVKENGLENAIKKGMANEQGEYIHTQGFSKGEVIDKKAIYGSAVGIFQTDEGIVARDVSIGSYAMDKVLPVCKESKFTFKEGKKSGQLVKNANVLYFNGATVLEDVDAYDEDAVKIYLGYVEQFFGDIIFDSMIDGLKYLESKKYDKNAFIGVRATCMDIFPNEDPTRDISINFETEDDDFIVWVHPTSFAGLNITDGIDGILFMNVTPRRDGTLRYNCGGFLPIEDDL